LFAEGKEESFSLIFNVLPDQFLEPGRDFITPPLRMKVKHHLLRKRSFLHRPDNIIRPPVPPFQKLRIGHRILLRSLIPDIEEMPIPAVKGER
ncbi:MAG: hypothetical protein KKA81_17465, partial [Bacteroidetes bacterium]|nr:hypothetical protein [Bacteroidota bacterium]